MTAHRDLKKLIRERQAKTGESYTAARLHVLREPVALPGSGGSQPSPQAPSTVDAVVIKVNRASARVQVCGEAGQLTYRSSGLWNVVPGHLVTLTVEKRWMWQGGEYASGKVDNPRIDAARLGLNPLPLTGGELADLRDYNEYYDIEGDPYTPLWRKFTAQPRADYEMDPIAWGALPGTEADENLTCDAADLCDAGDESGARQLLMDALAIDLRCIDAHALLGYLEFDLNPKIAMESYEIGMRIAELSLPPGFDGLLQWGPIYNRPYLRSLLGYGLCLWRQGRVAQAREVFERIVFLNPMDNQGVRGLLQDLAAGRKWESRETRSARSRH